MTAPRGRGLCDLFVALSPGSRRDLPHSSCSVSTGALKSSRVRASSGRNGPQAAAASDTCCLCVSPAPLSPSASCLAALALNFCLFHSPSRLLFFPSPLFALPFSSAFSFSFISSSLPPSNGDFELLTETFNSDHEGTKCTRRGASSAGRGRGRPAV